MENVLLAILANDNFARAAAESQFTELKRAYPRDVRIKHAPQPKLYMESMIHHDHCLSLHSTIILTGFITAVCSAVQLSE